METDDDEEEEEEEEEVKECGPRLRNARGAQSKMKEIKERVLRHTRSSGVKSKRK